MDNLDTSETLSHHRNIIQKKKFLKNVYTDFYNILKKVQYPSGKLVELGSGAGFIKKLLPKTITSDVIAGPGIDKVFFAEKMPFSASSISGFMMINVFHHIKNPKLALQEMERCLRTNGKIVMIEPSNTLLARFIYKNFHHENFDIKAGWKIKGVGRLSDANIALPWIVFIRDKKKLEKTFPTLDIVDIKCHTPFRYLLSGGLSKPQILPNFMYGVVKQIENKLSFLNPVWGMFMTIEIIKTNLPTSLPK